MISNASYFAGRHPRLEVERAMIYEPFPERDWMFSHHPSLCFFGGIWLAMWSNGRVGEDENGQRVLLSSSTDFASWSAPQVLAESTHILTASGFYVHQQTLVAYVSEYREDRTHTKLFARTSQNGRDWSELRDLNLPITPNHPPQPTRDGRLIIAGNYVFPYSDDASGLSGWHWTSFAGKNCDESEDNPHVFWRVARSMELPAALCEGSWIELDDGQIVMLLRATGDGYSGFLWQTRSDDNGQSWSRPTPTDFSDNDTKLHLGRLPDGRYYYVGCPDNRNRGARNPLVLSLSDDGSDWKRHFIIADEPFAMKQDGKYKGGDYGYPTTWRHENTLGVIVSRQKEAVEVLRFDWTQL